MSRSRERKTDYYIHMYQNFCQVMFPCLILFSSSFFGSFRKGPLIFGPSSGPNDAVLCVGENPPIDATSVKPKLETPSLTRFPGPIGSMSVERCLSRLEGCSTSCQRPPVTSLTNACFEHPLQDSGL